MIKRIILDTNFLLIPFNFKVDIFDEIKKIVNDKCLFCIIDKTKDELNNIIDKQKGKDKDAARFALKIIEKYNPELIISDSQNVDDAIVLIAEQQPCIVATQDKGLKDRVKSLKRDVIVLRQKTHLEFA